MNYLSICSGIEAATVAWHPLGWRPLAFAEIEPFPSAVLAHHWPDVPNLGDMTTYGNWPAIRPDLIVGGTPCQAFSVAGMRRGLADARGNLSLTFCQLADHFDPEWIVWENVPGVLSSKDNAFGCFLAGLCGASEPLIPVRRWANAGLVSGPKRTVAWRVLDAQFFGVAQRRRRVFVVAVRGPGNWRSAAALFPVADGLHWHSPPSRATREAITCDPQGIAGNVSSKWSKGTGGPSGDEHYNLIAHALRGEGFDASEDGTGRGTPIVPVAFPAQMSGTQFAATEDLSPNLQAKNPTAVAFNLRGREGGAMPEVDPDGLACQRAACGGSSRSYVATSAVRRLTPRECERLQGFPDDHTLISWRGKLSDACPDGPRYKALGNSMAVPVMRWLGERINLISNVSTL